MAKGRPPRGGAPRRGPKPPGKAPRRGPAPAPRTDAPAEAAGDERLQKVLAHAGIGSRRACEEVILQGRVTVDGQVVRELGSKVDPRRARIQVDGQSIHQERMVYYAVSKPKGYVSTNNDPAGRPRVVDLLPEIPQRVYTVGRLDEMSTGLILLTNDGELANRLAHPRFGVEKLYRVVVAGMPQREVLDKLTEGVWLAEGKVRARRVRVTGRKGQATVLEMVLAEGKNREVRRMLAKLGHKVMSLTRIAVGPITLKGLGPGEYRSLTGAEIELLRKVAAGIAVSPARFSERKPPRPQGPGRPRPAGTGPGRKEARPGGTGRPSTGGPPRRKPPTASATGGPSRRKPPAASATGPGSSHARPPRPQGLPPSQRKAVADAEGPPRRSKRPGPPAVEPPARRIIGLDPGPGTGPGRKPGAPRRARPAPAKRRFPRASLGPRRPGSEGPGDTEE